MDRQDEIMAIGKELLEERFLKDVERITEEIKKNSFFKELIAAFDAVFQKVLVLQEDGEKEDIAYVVISYLRSSIITGSYDFLIHLYDESFYFDPKETSGTWSAKYIMDYYENQLDYVERQIGKRMIRLQKSELNDLKMSLAGDYFKIILGIFMEHIQDIVGLESFEKMYKLENVKIVYGGFYDTCVTLYDAAEEVII
ncbi:hypothetical protein [Anaeromicropila populeti]|uniref:Uncharacterized protein n=1 Tax=Anaeromicropila populeti TaxID=37658 RepID=A0A1I6K7J3_9FIRM|nr:hypothetical protein [Anaeromicropila populeti]SFR87182.1 hypothetical protein SAMN05661086_02255 [Anaeromicropila populeti]